MKTWRSLRQLVIQPSTMSWLEQVVGQSDQTGKGALKSLKAEYDRLQARIGTMYMDRLDRLITLEAADKQRALLAALMPKSTRKAGKSETTLKSPFEILAHWNSASQKGKSPGRA
jgi:hypothetical protein